MSSVVGDLVDAGEASIKKLAACAPKIDAAGDDAAAIKAVNNDATRFIREADGTLRKLEAEAKVAAPSQRREVMEQLAQLKASLQTARSALQKANDGKARASLLKPADRARALDNAASDKLQSASEKSSASTLKLQQAQQVLSETQDLGVKCVGPGGAAPRASGASRPPPRAGPHSLLPPSPLPQRHGHDDDAARSTPSRDGQGVEHEFAHSARERADAHDDCARANERRAPHPHHHCADCLHRRGRVFWLP